MINYVKKGIQHKGFALVEGMSSCPTYYGRKNRKGSAVDMIMNLKDTYVDIKVKDKMTPEQLEGKLFMGEFHESVEPEYTQLYQEIIDRFK